MTNAERIKTDRTIDGIRVVAWSDGSVTDGLGAYWTNHRLSVEAACLVVGESCLCEGHDEVRHLIRCAAKLQRRGHFTPGDLRVEAWGPKPEPPLRFVWEVYRADRNGKPATRVAVLPRIRWPGLAVWDHCTGGRGGRYELMSLTRVSGSEPANGRGEPLVRSTGLRFRNLNDLSDHLRSL